MRQFISENLKDITVASFSYLAYLTIAIVWTLDPLSIMTGVLSVNLDRQLDWNDDSKSFVEKPAISNAGVVTFLKNGSKRDEILSYEVKGFNVETTFFNEETKESSILIREDINGSKYDAAITIDTISLNGQEQVAFVSVGHDPIMPAQTTIKSSKGNINGASLYSSGEKIAYVAIFLLIGAAFASQMALLRTLVNKGRLKLVGAISTVYPRTVDGKTKTQKRHVFLSYSNLDIQAIKRLREDLRAAGELVWCADDLLPGQDPRHEFRKAMKNAYAAVFCFSAEPLESNTSNLYAEAYDAIQAYREYAPGQVYLIPVRLSECEIPMVEIDSTRTLNSLYYVDLFPSNKRKEGLMRLIASIRKTPFHPLNNS